MKLACATGVLLALLACAPAGYAGGDEHAPSAVGIPVTPDMPCSAVSPLTEPPLNLTRDQEKRAQRVYRKAIVITAHDHCFHPGDFADQDDGGVTVRTIKLTTDGIYWQDAKRINIDVPVEGWRERGRAAFAALRQTVAGASGKIVIIRSVDDIYRAKRERKLGVILSFEGARPLAGNLANIAEFHALGLRDLQPFWAVPSPLRTRENLFTEFGIDVIREANRLGVVLDFSHLGDAAFEQALAATRHPLLISHCAVAGVYEAAGRGTDQLGDETIRKIARNGGVICLHFYAGYIRPRHGKSPTVVDLADHIDYIRRLVGINHVALGTDYFPEKTATWIGGAENTRGMINVARELVRRGYTDAEIEKVLGMNLVRVYRAVWRGRG